MLKDIITLISLVLGLSYCSYCILFVEPYEILETKREKVSAGDVVGKTRRVFKGDEYIHKLAKEYAIPFILLKIVYLKESSNGLNPTPRYEERCYRSKKWAKFGHTVRKQLCTSYGKFQVMGFHALDKKIPLSELTVDPQTQDEAAVSHLASLWFKNWKVRDVEQRLWLTWRQYNGSGEMAKKYADHALQIYRSGKV